MHVLVVGLGISGRSACEFLLNQGDLVTTTDRNSGTLKETCEVKTLCAKGLNLMEESDWHPFDLVVVSPGVPQSNPLLIRAKESGIEVIGEIELACRHLNQPLIGVTGTNGKTTVTLMVGHVLNFVGIKARVLGNGGVPLTSEVSQLTDEIIVCELSSYQLETMHSQVIDAAAILNITPDHLDRYSGMDAYASAKIHIGDCLKPGARLFISPQINCEFGSLLQKHKENIELIFYDTYKSHDDENYMAAFALCSEMGVGLKAFEEAMKTFSKPPHRIEFVCTFKGVRYFNDSKGTNLDAVKRAIEVMEGPVVLIAGGVDKGLSFISSLIPFKNKVKTIIAIGEAKNRIKSELAEHLSVIESDSLESSILQASSIAEEGENVLLSPGCSSFDMFQNFEERGDTFKELVLLLSSGENNDESKRYNNHCSVD